MDIVLICDRNYLIPTKVTINTIAKNKLPEEKITVHIIGSELNENDFASFRELENALFTIKVYLPSMEVETFQRQHSHVSKAALYKFYLPIILQDVDKVLYLDSDMIVLGSLSRLYNVDLESRYAAAVKDMIAETQMDLKRVLGIDTYFNSGMMLLNLNLLRKDNVSAELWNTRQSDCSMDFMDQNILNKVFDKKVTIVSPEYNYMQTLQDIPLKYVASYYGLEENAMQAVSENPIILHLTDKKKPWNSVYARRADVWFRYLLNEDIFGVVCSMCENMEEQLQVKGVMLEQEHENYLFMKNAGKFEFENLKPLERRILGIKDQIQEMAAEEIKDNKKIIIYGAGQFGRALFKCLWSVCLSQYVIGFAVKDTKKNVGELFGRNVLCVEDCKVYRDDCVMLVGVKDETGRVVSEIKEKGVLSKVIDMNDYFMDKYRGCLE